MSEEEQDSPRKIRLAKLIAGRGLASRREAEEWIREGRLSVNGETTTEPGTVVDPERDHVRLDGRRLPPEPPKVYYLMYKPRGFITGRRDPSGRKGVLDLVEDLPQRVEPVGRLDFDTEGALILTNDGELAHKLTHPSTQVPRHYVAKVWRTPDEKTLLRIAKGVRLEDGPSGPCKVRVMKTTDEGNSWVELTVTEGRNRLVRRLMQAVNHPVAKLRRLSFGTISIRGMERGQVRPLTSEEVSRLQDLAAGRAPSRAGHGFREKKGFAKAKPKIRRGTKLSLDKKPSKVKR